MTIKSILAPLDGSGSSEHALRAAFNMARQCNAHVEALHVRSNPKDAVPLLGEGMSGAVIEDIIVAAERESNDRAHKARQVFDNICEAEGVVIVDGPPSDGDVTARWVEDTGREDEATGLRGRLADLIVLPKPTDQSSVSATMTLNAALVETGRGVLVVPDGSVENIGRRVAISWNGSAEAARAVAAALPLIKSADRVLILTIDSDESPAKVASELSDYLLWHGVNADMDVSPVTERQVGETVLSKCAEWEADLLVMGAYTHSRLRQLIMGGVTRHILAEAAIPVVMVN
jgi:nucleotide-binding universal stress UspA family protein